MVRIFHDRTNERRELEYEGSIEGLLETLGINKEEVVVVKNGLVVPESESCTGDDELQVLSVVSGG